MVKPDLILTKTQIEGPCVYCFWFKDQCVYIGFSEVGLSRPINPQHNVRQYDDFKYDRVEIFKQDTIERARFYEEVLIKEFKPKFNIIFKPLPANKPIQGEGGRFLKSSWRNATRKSKDETTGEFLVVDEAGKVLFRSVEKFERDRFHMQERLRIAKGRRFG